MSRINFKLIGFCLVCVLVALSSFTPNTFARNRRPESIQWGFNTHLHVNSEYRNLDNFIDDIDQISQMGVESPYIRFQLENIELFPRTDLSRSDIDCSEILPINCNPENIEIFTEALEYAHANGVKVYVILVPPYWAKYYSEPDFIWENQYNLEEYSQILNDYLDETVGRLSEMVNHWQIFNEANNHIFDSYAPIEIQENPEYLNKLEQATELVTSKINTIKPDIKTSVSAGGWPVNEALYDEFELYFDRLAIYTDSVAIGLYPDNDIQQIIDTTRNINELSKRYQKPVDIAEFGVCVDQWRFDEQDQLIYLSMQQIAINRSRANKAMIYQLTDNPEFAGPCENTFGIQYEDRTPKKAYYPVTNYMQNNWYLR